MDVNVKKKTNKAAKSYWYKYHVKPMCIFEARTLWQMDIQKRVFYRPNPISLWSHEIWVSTKGIPVKLAKGFLFYASNMHVQMA